MKPSRAKNILKSCFWEYTFSENEIEKMAWDKNILKQKFLFEKILSNSSDVLRDLKIFPAENIKKLIREYKVPKFNFKFLNRRYLIVKYYFTAEEVYIPELTWKK